MTIEALPLDAPRIYIAGPYTLGDVAVNVRTAMEAATAVLALGGAPYVPHLSHFWHMAYPQPYDTWLALDLVWMQCCAALLRLPGVSTGADRETAYARDVLHIPVWTTMQALQAWIQGER